MIHFAFFFPNLISIEMGRACLPRQARINAPARQARPISPKRSGMRITPRSTASRLMSNVPRNALQERFQIGPKQKNGREECRGASASPFPSSPISPWRPPLSNRRRAAVWPIGCLMIGLAELQYRMIGPGPAKDLQPHRQSVFPEAGRHA